MKSIETFFNIWNWKYPHLAGRIHCTMNTERLECGSFSSELTFEFHDDNGDEGLYYKMSYLVKMVFGSVIVASYTHDLNGLFLHQFHVRLN